MAIPSIAPEDDPSVIDRVLKKQSAQGNVVILKDTVQQPQQLLDLGYQSVTAVLQGAAPLARIEDGVRQIRDGVFSFVSGLRKVTQTVVLPGGVRPQKHGLSDAARFVVKLKLTRQRETVLVDVNTGEVETVASELDALQALQRQAQSLADDLQGQIDSRVGILYPIVSKAFIALGAAVELGLLRAEDLGALRAYMRDRYDRGAATRKDHALRDQKNLDKLTAQAEQDQREKMIEDLLSKDLLGVSFKDKA